MKDLKFYFDTKEFPYDGNFKSSSATWPNLACCLVQSAAENGFNLLQKSMGDKTATIKRMNCTRGLVSRSSTSKSEAPPDYRKSYLKADRRTGSCPEGCDLPRRRCSTRTSCKSGLCKVKLVFGVDSSGFFMHGGTGEKKHTNHPKMFTDIVPLTIRWLNEVEKNSLHNYVKAGLPSSRAANVLCETSNVLVTRTAAWYISETMEYGEHCSSSTDSSKKTMTTTASRLFATVEIRKGMIT